MILFSFSFYFPPSLFLLKSLYQELIGFEHFPDYQVGKSRDFQTMALGRWFDFISVKTLCSNRNRDRAFDFTGIMDSQIQ